MVDYLGSSEGPGAYGAADGNSKDAVESGETNTAYEYKVDMPSS